MIGYDVKQRQVNPGVKYISGTWKCVTREQSQVAGSALARNSESYRSFKREKGRRARARIASNESDN